MSMYDTYHPDYPHPPRRSNSVLPLLLLLILAAALFWRFWPREEGNGLDPNAQPRPVEARGDLADDEKSTIALYRQSAPSVVHVNRKDFQGDMFGLNVEEVRSGSGSGFVWDTDGHIVTNHHVVAGASGCEVILADHSKWKARVVGLNPDNDLAVLKIDAPKGKLHPIMIGTSHDLKVGQKAFAIGNPFGLDQSLTTGVISALDREIVSREEARPIKGAIQTNAAINPGNSGGPLLDSAGRLIGVNTAIVSPSGAFSGIGFAIPVDEVNRLVPQLIRAGHIDRPGIGVVIASDQLAQQFDIDGVLIRYVTPDSPAEKAGLRGTRMDRNGHVIPGDVIIAVDDTVVHNVKELHSALEQYKIGDSVTLTIERGGKQQNVKVTLQAIQ